MMNKEKKIKVQKVQKVKKLTKKQQQEEEIKKLKEELKQLKEEKKQPQEINIHKINFFNVINELKQKQKKFFYLVDKKNKITKIKNNDFFILQKFTNKKYDEVKKMKKLNNNYDIINIIDNEKEYKIKIKIFLSFDVSESEGIKRIFNKIYKGLLNKTNIDNFIDKKVNEYFLAFGDNTVSNVNYYYITFSSILTTKESNEDAKMKSTFIYKNMILEREKPLKIFNSIYDHYEPPEGQNCLKSYIYEICPKISKNNINKILGDEPTSQTLKIFCIKYNIKLRIYNFDGVLIESNEIIKKTSYKAIILCIYNNHIYPINKEKILLKIDLINEYIYIPYDKMDELFIEFLTNGTLPDNIKINDKGKNKILSFEIIETVKNDKGEDTKQKKKIIYHANKDFEECKKILDVFGLGDKMNIYCSYINIYKIIEKLYLKENIDSLWEKNNLYIKGGYTFYNDEIKDIEDRMTIDKNKAYSHSLLKLKFLIIVDDIRHSEVNIYNNEEIIDHYLYNVVPENSSIILPDANIYSGDILKYAKKEGLNFEIKEILKTKKVDNYYKNMINDIYAKIDHKQAKEIINCMIGHFGKIEDITTNNKNIKVANENETRASTGYNLKINETFNIIYDIEENIKIFNRTPIRNQVIDHARITIYKQIKKLNLSKDDIIQIKTDSITYKNKICSDLDFNTELDGWKKEENFKKIENRTWSPDFVSLQPEQAPVVCDVVVNANNLYIGNAGCGKSYYILNTLINKLNDYIILTPSYATLHEYKIKNLNCNVIQKYVLTNTIPKEKNIIIDEVGMLDYEALIQCIKENKLNKFIYGFGDFSQLLAVNESSQLDSYIFKNTYFNYIIYTNANHRNNFSAKYYDYLRNIKDEDIEQELIKYNSLNYYEAEHIIAYRHKTVKKYNSLMLEKLNLNYDDVGVKVICKSNKLKDKNIYNNFEFIITENDEEERTLTLDNEFIITYKEYKKYFILGYAKTLYAIQGRSVKSFYYAPEDNCMLDGRKLYTLISRLRQEKIK